MNNICDAHTLNVISNWLHIDFIHGGDIHDRSYKKFSF